MRNFWREQNNGSFRDAIACVKLCASNSSCAAAALNAAGACEVAPRDGLEESAGGGAPELKAFLKGTFDLGKMSSINLLVRCCCQICYSFDHVHHHYVHDHLHHDDAREGPVVRLVIMLQDVRRGWGKQVTLMDSTQFFSYQFLTFWFVCIQDEDQKLPGRSWELRLR